MDFLPMFMSFLIACIVIIVCLTQKQMKIARAFFLGFGVLIGTCSLLLMYADSLLIQRPEALETILTVLLSVSATVFDSVAVVIVIATIILSVLAIKKIAEYIKNKRKDIPALGKKEKPIAEPVFACARKIFVLYCRWNN